MTTLTQTTVSYSELKEMTEKISDINDLEMLLGGSGSGDLEDELIHKILPDRNLFWELWTVIPEGYSGEDAITLEYETDEIGFATSFQVLSPETLVTDKVRV